MTILIYGDLILDEYIEGDCNKISPERPIPIVEFKKSEYKLGGAGNVANNLKQINNDIFVFGSSGKDETSHSIKKLLKKNKINFSLCKIPNLNIPKKTRIISGQQQIVRIDNEKPFFELTKKYSKRILEIFRKKIKKTKILIISDYGKGSCEFNLVKKMIQLANKNKIKVFVDPPKNHNNYNIYKNVYLIKPNFNELRKINENLKINEIEKIKKTSQKLKKYLNCEVVLTTLGSMGMLCCYKNKNILINQYEEKVYDVSGAGDTVLAVISHLVEKGHDIITSSKIANYCAGYVVTIKGTAVIPKSVLKKFELQIL